jgi:para-nitrobenzyl esterase
MTVDAVFGMAGRDGSAVLDVYRSNRPDAEPHEIAAAIESDRMFVVPAIRMADAQAAHNPNTRLYRFDWQADVAWGAHHFIEVPFAFDQLDNPQARGFSGDDPPRSLSAATHAAWVGFVRDGDPNHEGLPEWPRYDAETRPTMLFNDTCSVENRPADDEVSLWEGVV